MSVENIYEQNLGMNQANFAPLTPLSFLERSASVYPERPSVIHGDTTYTWAETYARSCRLASALSKMGIGEGTPCRLWEPILRRPSKRILGFL